MNEPFDVAIVGAGPAGIAAACTLADAGIKTIVFERGEFAGSKNVSGGVLYGYQLRQIIPDFVQAGCPIERNIVETRYWYLAKESGYSINYRDNIFNVDRKFNHFTVGRAKFDLWFSQQARRKGALVVFTTVVLDLLKDSRGHVTGVVAGRSNGEVKAKITLLADGINSPLAARTGFRPEPKPEHVALAVKEIIDLPPDLIEERLGVSKGDGVTIEVLGTITGGMNGIGAIYTNQSSLSVVIGANLADFAANKFKPYELMEDFKQHPMVAPLICGGQPREYVAHWLPEGGYDAIPRLYGDGYLIAGDSAGLFNAPHREGNNLAMASGKMAAETIVEAFQKNDFSRKTLSGYGERLAASFVLSDMNKYRGFPHLLAQRKELFDQIPRVATYAAREFLTVNGVSKKQKQKFIMQKIKQEKLSLFSFAKLLWQAWRAVK